MTDVQPNHRHSTDPKPSTVTAVSCNRCGGTLEIPERTHFTTCGYCGTQLRVERSATTLATIELDELRNRTDDLERDLSALRSDRLVEQLDRKWEARRAELSISHGENELRLPTLHGALLRFLSALGPLLLLVFGPFAAFGTTALPFVGAMMMFGAVQGGIELYKYLQYRQASADYWAERSRLLAEHR